MVSEDEMSQAKFSKLCGTPDELTQLELAKVARPLKLKRAGKDKKKLVLDHG